MEEQFSLDKTAPAEFVTWLDGIRPIDYAAFVETQDEPCPDDVLLALQSMKRAIARMLKRVGRGTDIGDMVTLMTTDVTRRNTPDYVQAVDRVAGRIAQQWAFFHDNRRDEAAWRELAARQDDEGVDTITAKRMVLMQVLPEVALWASREEVAHRFEGSWVRRESGDVVRFQPLKLRWRWRLLWLRNEAIKAGMADLLNEPYPKPKGAAQGETVSLGDNLLALLESPYADPLDTVLAREEISLRFGYLRDNVQPKTWQVILAELHCLSDGEILQTLGIPKAGTLRVHRSKAAKVLKRFAALSDNEPDFNNS